MQLLDTYSGTDWLQIYGENSWGSRVRDFGNSDSNVNLASVTTHPVAVTVARRIFG